VARGQEGFSFLDILMGVLLLSISFVGLTAYSGTQRKALYKASNTTEAANTAVTAMEKTKIPLSDSAAFRNKWNKLDKPSITTTTIAGKKYTYTATTSLSRVGGTDNLIKIQVKLAWTGGHSYNLGMVVVQP
jgi:Tfp pilus assembly protein PilV